MTKSFAHSSSKLINIGPKIFTSILVLSLGRPYQLINICSKTPSPLKHHSELLSVKETLIVEEVGIVVKSMSFGIRQNHVNLEKLPELWVCFLICRLWTPIATRRVMEGIKCDCTIKSLVLCQRIVSCSASNIYTTLCLLQLLNHSCSPSSLWILLLNSLGMELLKTELYLQQPCYTKCGPDQGAFVLPENLRIRRLSGTAQDLFNQNLPLNRSPGDLYAQ